MASLLLPNPIKWRSHPLDMCQTCGCAVVGDVAINANPHHRHHESSGNQPKQTIRVHQKILNQNDQLAEQNREYFKTKGVFVLNILSSPGSGKTALIERMLQDCSKFCIGVIVGDLETDNDAQRLRSHHAPAVQITTGNACHLEADMVARATRSLNLDALDLLVIENVGNLVCPAYDLGEDLHVVLLSVTEGEDKPLKYPTIFKTTQVVVVNKIDIAQAVEFDREQAIANIGHIAPQAKLFEVSAKTGQGMEDWYSYLRKNILEKKLETGLPQLQRT